MDEFLGLSREVVALSETKGLLGKIGDSSLDPSQAHNKLRITFHTFYSASHFTPYPIEPHDPISSHETETIR